MSDSFFDPSSAFPVTLSTDKQEMAWQIAQYDWATTPLGPPAQWPVSLRAVVTLMLDTPEAMVWWGVGACQIYNDAYAARIAAPGANRAVALGQNAASSWQHCWKAIGPQVGLVLAGQSSTGYQDALFTIKRNGALEDTYWTYLFTPVRDDHGAPGGVLVISTETTERVLSVRRQQTLDLLRQELSSAQGSKALAAAVALVASQNRHDLHSASLISGREVTTAPSAVPLQLVVAAREIGIDIRLAIVFALAPSLPLNAGYRKFLQQFTILTASAQQRIDTEARRRMMEAEHDRLLLDAPVGAAVMLGEDLVYRLVNAIYAAVSGRVASDMVGKRFIEVFPELQGTQVHEKFNEAYRVGNPFVSMPTLVQIHRHGGALDDRYFTYNLTPLRHLEGAVYGLMVIAVDSTVQVEARAQVEQLNTDLQASARAKDEFLALLGHELRNPLAPIVTALELTRMRDRSENREQVVIRRQVSHLTRLVDDLLDVSRIARRKVELRRESVQVNEVVMRAVDMATPLIDQRQQQLQVDMAPGTWYGDPARLAQLVSNLRTNASRYSECGADITLQTRFIDNELIIEVTDTGMGLSADLLPRIF